MVDVPQDLVIFDGDDTLWASEPLYDRARAQAGAIVAATGLDPAEWESRERARDLENVTRLGFDPQRFPLSCVQAYEELAEDRGREAEARVAEAVRTAAASVFTAVAPLMDGALDILDKLEGHFRLALLTKGDRAVQERRIADSGLAHFFERVEIVGSKTEAEFKNLVAAMAAPPERTWSVGNSLASDINPALRLGMSAVWIDAHVWEHERRDVTPHVGRLIVAESLREATDALLGCIH